MSEVEAISPGSLVRGCQAHSDIACLEGSRNYSISNLHRYAITWRANMSIRVTVLGYEHQAAVPSSNY